MPDSAAGELRMTSWTETRTEPLADGGRFVQARIEEDFAGGLDGASRWDDLLFYRADGTAAFVTLGEIRGELNGRTGSFVVTTTGTFNGERAVSEWTIVPGSGTGELRGIVGTGTMATRPGRPGTYPFDYRLPPAAEPDHPERTRGASPPPPLRDGGGPRR